LTKHATLTLKRSLQVTLIIVLVLLIDQLSKFYIKLNFEYNQDYPIFGLNWARLHFVENEGMAFGITFDWAYGKLLLSSFRILMVAGLIWYIRLIVHTPAAPAGYLWSIGLITAGALGNILDSAFYGLIFTESPYHGGLAQLVPPGDGYGTFLHGKVVDMLYFPMKYITMPSWMPGIGGEEYLFFSPIFNVADAAITTGVLSILLFQRRFFRESLLEEEPVKPVAEVTEVAENEEANAVKPEENPT
jgi:signal peptidase II